MSGNPNSLTRFWHELKRRKVFRVVAMYAGTAYIIIEVVNNLVAPLHLPSWIPTLVILLLAIGLPVTAILAWIFDLTPEGIKKTGSIEEETEKQETPARPVKRSLKPSDIVIAVLVVVVAVLALPKIFNQDSLRRLRSSDGKISVAVMPFQNMTSDTTWDIWQGGIQNELIASLTNSEELKVRQTETVNSILKSGGNTNYASITPSFASAVSQKLEAIVLIYGSINKAGDIVRVNTQLIDSKKEEVIKSFQIESPAREDKIFDIIDSLSAQVKNFLIITKLQQESSIDNRYVSPTKSPEAYKLFMQGQKAFNSGDFTAARNMYLQAIGIDSNFYSAITMLISSYHNEGQIDQAKKWCLKVYDKREQMPLRQNIHVSWHHALLFETPKEEIKYINQLLEFDDQFPPLYYELGRIYVGLGQYDKAIPVMRKALEIYKKWESKPRWANDYIMLGFSYHETGRYRQEEKLYKKAEQDFPDAFLLVQRQAILSLTVKDTITANRHIEKFISLLKDNSISDRDMNFGLGYIYTEGGFLDKAEECYRRALSLEAENPSCINNLAWFLIDNDRNVNEGLELIDKALKIRPNSYLYLGNKGLGLYKQGKYDEALEVLERSWKLRPVYNQEEFLFLEKVRKAAASQKNN
jgi:tetratricopeptide (TPR) repeat protein